ncbi:MAG: hypothetical protein KDB01_01395 [Planctomycetaceae bacterium]|nr:hypothetical protein [Planctomycetaceae bacterium]
MSATRIGIRMIECLNRADARWLCLAAVLVLTGCNSSDTSSRLTEGQFAVTFAPQPLIGNASQSVGVIRLDSAEGSGLELMETGKKVRVVSDDSEEASSDRWVTVAVLRTDLHGWLTELASGTSHLSPAFLEMKIRRKELVPVKTSNKDSSKNSSEDWSPDFSDYISDDASNESKQ